MILILQVFVVDSSDDKRIKDSNKELKLLIEDPLLGKIPLLVFANKQDLIGLQVDEIIDHLDLNKIDDRKWSIFACSALKGDGITEGLKWLISSME